MTDVDWAALDKAYDAANRTKVSGSELETMFWTLAEAYPAIRTEVTALREQLERASNQYNDLYTDSLIHIRRAGAAEQRVRELERKLATINLQLHNARFLSGEEAGRDA